MNYAIQTESVQNQLNKKDSYGLYKGIAMPIACGVLVAVTPNQYRHVDYAQLPAGWYQDNFMGVESHLVNLALPDRTEIMMPQVESLAEEFPKLVKQWKEETFALSSLTKIYAHPAYQRIIGMGTDGLPYVLKELQKNQGRWFYALKFMAGETGKDVAAGINNFEDAKAAWLEWGYKNNHI